MKKLISTLILILFSSVGCSHFDSIRGDVFTLKGRIINEIQLPFYCGSTAWGTVIEFEIINFSDSDYKLDSIGVIFTCPEFYGKGFFVVGEIYYITLADENQADFGFVIPNKYKLEKYNLDDNLWVLEAHKVIEETK